MPISHPDDVGRGGGDGGIRRSRVGRRTLEEILCGGAVEVITTELWTAHLVVTCNEDDPAGGTKVGVPP